MSVYNCKHCNECNQSEEFVMDTPSVNLCIVLLIGMSIYVYHCYMLIVMSFVLLVPYVLMLSRIH